jgi:hypothetical protein
MACLRGAANRKEFPNAVTLGRKSLHDEHPRTVKLTIRDRKGVVIFNDSTTVKPTRYQVNGSGCPPITWSATVNAFGRDRLVVAKAER